MKRNPNGTTKKGKGLMFWLPIIAVTGGLGYLIYLMVKPPPPPEKVVGREEARGIPLVSKKKIFVGITSPRHGENISVLKKTRILYKITNNEASSQKVFVSAKIWDIKGNEVWAYPLQELTVKPGVWAFEIPNPVVAGEVMTNRVIGLTLFEDKETTRAINRTTVSFKMTTIG